MREIRPNILDIINDLRLSDLNIYIICNTIRFIYFEENYEWKNIWYRDYKSRINRIVHNLHKHNGREFFSIIFGMFIAIT